MKHLVQTLNAEAPDLSLDNQALHQSSAHTEDTGHENAVINLLSKIEGRNPVDIPDLLSNIAIYTDY